MIREIGKGVTRKRSTGELVLLLAVWVLCLVLGFLAFAVH